MANQDGKHSDQTTTLKKLYTSLPVVEVPMDELLRAVVDAEGNSLHVWSVAEKVELEFHFSSYFSHSAFQCF